MSGSYFGSGLTSSFDARLGAKVDRALGRLGEGEYERWMGNCDDFAAQGFVADVAAAKALDVVFEGDRWRRFRK